MNRDTRSRLHEYSLNPQIQPSEKYEDRLNTKIRISSSLTIEDFHAKSTNYPERQSYLKVCADRLVDLDHGKRKLSASDRKCLDQMTGGRHAGSRHKSDQFSTLAYNPYARDIFFGEVLARLHQLAKEHEGKLYFATLIDRTWHLNRRDKKLPLKSMMRRVKDTLRAIGWEGILWVEVQAVVNMGDRHLMPHFHGLLWKKDRKSLPLRRADARFNALFQGAGQARGIVLKPVLGDANAEITRMIRYATKYPDEAKSYIILNSGEGAFRSGEEAQGTMRNASSKNYSKKDRLRILRLFSQHEVEGIVLAVGKGTRIRKAASKKLTAYARQIRKLRPNPQPDAVVRILSSLLRD